MFKVIYKTCGEYIAVMELLEDSITNESKKNIIDTNCAKYRTNKVKVILIIHKFTLEIINDVENSFYEKKLKYIEEKNYNMNLHKIYCEEIHYFKKIDCAFYYTLDVTSYTGHYIRWNDDGESHMNVII